MFHHLIDPLQINFKSVWLATVFSDLTTKHGAETHEPLTVKPDLLSLT